MGVLESMRSGTDSTAVQVVLAAVVVSFMFWFGQPQGQMGGAVASVNGEQILDTELQRAYSQAYYRLERQQGTLSDEQQRNLREQVRQGLIRDEVVLQEADRLKLRVSDTEVARTMLTNPGFKDQDGKFDRDLMRRALKRQGMSEAQFHEQVREDLKRQKLRELVLAPVNVSDASVKRMWVDAQTTVDIQYVRIRAANFFEKVDTPDAEVDAWLGENEAEAKEIYDRDFDRLYNHKEKVRLGLIKLVKTPEGPEVADLLPKLQALHDQLKEGADFEPLARQWSEDTSAEQGGDLGLKDVTGLPANIAEAIEGLEVGTYTRVITTEGDVRLYKVLERIEAKVDAFEDVKRDIARRRLQEQGAPALSARFAEEELLVKWKEAGSAPMELLATVPGLTPVSTGPKPINAPPGPLSPPAEMMKAAKTAEVGSVLPEVYEAAGILWVGQLMTRESPDESEFEQNKDQILAQVLQYRRATFWEGWLSEQVAQATVE